jgi:hypothetical protein
MCTLPQKNMLQPSPEDSLPCTIRFKPVRHKNNTSKATLLPTPFNGPFGGKIWASYLTWRSTLKPGETVVSVTRWPQWPVASPGKVLGDRSTLYKYLNPHLLAATTGPQVHSTVYLVDSVKGTILYSSAIHAAKKGRCDLKVSIVENWLVYHYWDDGHAGGSVHGLPGWRIASVGLHDGTLM